MIRCKCLLSSSEDVNFPKSEPSTLSDLFIDFHLIRRMGNRKGNKMKKRKKKRRKKKKKKSQKIQNETFQL